MALIGKIRNRLGWLMLVLVALGVVGFLLMDATSMNQMGRSRDVAVVGKVNSKEILRTAMDDLSELYRSQNVSTEEAQSYAWSRLVEESILEEQVRKVGLSVTTAEMNALFADPDDRMISPLVRQNFSDPRSGGFDRNVIRQTLEALKDPDFEGMDERQREQTIERQKALRNLERQVAYDRTSGKYLAMLQKGFYMPTAMVEKEYKRENQSFNFAYVRVPYSAIANDQVQVSDADLENYIKANAKRYQREATASIEYVTFQVRPSAKDSSELFVKMMEIHKELTESKEDTATVQTFDGELRPFATSEELVGEPQEQKDSLFAAAIGTVIGPYIAGNEYRLMKVLERKVLPDSVRALHIVRPVKTQEDYNREYMLLDSLRKAIKAGTLTFEAAAAANGTDGTKEKGGDLGFAGKGAFVKEFEDHIYNAKKDSVEIIFTQFGLHLVKVVEYKFESKKEGVRFAAFSTPIIPGAATVNAMRTVANEFITRNKTIEEMRNAAKEQNLPKAEASGIEQSAFNISGIGKNSTAAKIARWAHRPDIKANDVAREPYGIGDEELGYTRQFVVPALVARSDKGLASIKDPSVRREVERLVQNQKKAEIIKKNLAGVSSLEQVLEKYPTTKIENTTNPVAYNSAYIVGAGAEPKVVAVAALLEPNKVSAPIEGDQGVYLINVLLKNEAQPMQGIQMARLQVNQRAIMLVSQKMVDALKEKSTIVDNRSKIYY